MSRTGPSRENGYGFKVVENDRNKGHLAKTPTLSKLRSYSTLTINVFELGSHTYILIRHTASSIWRSATRAENAPSGQHYELVLLTTIHIDFLPVNAGQRSAILPPPPGSL